MSDKGQVLNITQLVSIGKWVERQSSAQSKDSIVLQLANNLL